VEAVFLTALIAGGIFFVSYMIGYNAANNRNLDFANRVIEICVATLCKDGYIKYSFSDDGDLLLYKLDEDTGQN